jgi:ketosteroid isomerase-like protein
MNQHEHLIEKFYTAFQQKDWKTMHTCYHNDVVFNDPAFQNLKGKEAKAMWHMLISRGKDLTLTFNQVKANELKGSCHWVATYSFSKTGRMVVNEIDASFEFKDGLIYRHTDYFDLWKWTRMALGMKGTLLGWTPFLQNKVRATAAEGLKLFIARNSEYKS